MTSTEGKTGDRISLLMAPKKAAFATLYVPRIDGTLHVKMVMERRVPRPKASLITPTYTASVWLSRDAGIQATEPTSFSPHVDELLAAFEDLHEDDLTSEFTADLLHRGPSCSVAGTVLTVQQCRMQICSGAHRCAMTL